MYTPPRIRPAKSTARHSSLDSASLHDSTTTAETPREAGASARLYDSNRDCAITIRGHTATLNRTGDQADESNRQSSWVNPFILVNELRTLFWVPEKGSKASR
jgi:hypothetical protein